MSYQALYRKFRPRTFDEVVGQSNIVQMLKNQISEKNFGHAYLFSGIRGVGKTSIAKIFSRAINCLNPIDSNPCNKCDHCLGILEESIMDVVEIDAASNNGVDNIREIRENIKYPPSEVEFKVYIVDEVHMLSKGAFNALLKTLEEPPSYAVFILATTEPHKIPDTILSRCQRFDFNRVKSEETLKHLAHITDNLGIKTTDEALNLIIRSSEGAMRDAIGALDKCVSSLESDNLTSEVVCHSLGVISDEIIFDMITAMKDKKTKEVLNLINEVIFKGKDINQLVKDIIQGYRDVMIFLTSKSADYLTVSEYRQTLLEQIESKLTISYTIRAIDIFSTLENQLRWSPQPRVLLELSVIKLMQPNYEESLSALKQTVEELNKKVDILEYELQKRPSKPVTTPIKSKKVFEKQEIDDKLIKDSLVDDDINDQSMSIDNEIINDESTYKLIMDNWGDVVAAIRSESQITGALLHDVEILNVKESVLILGLEKDFEFLIKKINQEEHKSLIERMIFSVTKQQLSVKTIIKKEQGKKNSSGNENKVMVSNYFDGFSNLTIKN